MDVVHNTSSSMDWDKCLICNTDDGELKCPADRTDGTGLHYYEDFLENVEGFRKLEALPVELACSEIDSAVNLVEHRAKWHNACQLKFATSKLERTKERHEKKRKSGGTYEQGDRKSKRQSLGTVTAWNDCIFCHTTQDELHSCSTLELDKSLRDMATELNDKGLLARISGGDLVAIEAQYHNNCLRAFKNRYRANKRVQERDNLTSTDSTYDEKMMQSRTFAELISYIDNSVEEGTYIFKLTELVLYETRLANLGIKKTINKTRLKDQLIAHYATEIQEQSDGKNTLTT